MGRRSRIARAWTLVLAALLVTAGCADAESVHAKHPKVRRQRHATQNRHVERPAAGGAVIGVGDVPGCVWGSPRHLGLLAPYHARVLRVVIDPHHGPDGQALGCVQAAVAAGLRVHFAIEYSNRWPIAHDVAYFRRVLAYYAPYAWAISIGNEQELATTGVSESAARYAAVWRAVEPVVARLAPHAVRVAGEVSPWGLPFLRAIYSQRLRGAQALSVHAYSTRLGFALNDVLSWERATRLPLWVTEGLAGPHAWPGKPHRERPVPLSQLRGAAVVDAWLG